MGVFSADESRIGTVYAVEADRFTLLGNPGSGYADGHYYAAIVLVGSVSEGRILLSQDAEAALILQEAYSQAGAGQERLGGTGGSSTQNTSPRMGESDSRSAAHAPKSDQSTSSRSRPGLGSDSMLIFALASALVGGAILFLLGGRRKTETRPQQGGEGGTTRFGMEDGRQ